MGGQWSECGLANGLSPANQPINQSTNRLNQAAVERTQPAKQLLDHPPVHGIHPLPLSARPPTFQHGLGLCKAQAAGIGARHLLPKALLLQGLPSKDAHGSHVGEGAGGNLSQALLGSRVGGLQAARLAAVQKGGAHAGHNDAREDGSQPPAAASRWVAGWLGGW